MRVLFDFELFGDVSMDSRISDVMLAIKRYLQSNLKEYDERIRKDRGFIIFTLTPSESSAAYCGSEDIELVKDLQPVLNVIKWESAIQDLENSESN